MLGSSESDAKSLPCRMSECLDGNQPEEALNLLDRTDDYVLDKHSWDIVPLTLKYLTTDNKYGNERLFNTCRVILETIADKCNPSEIVLQFLEQAEYSEDDIKLFTILKLLSESLKKIKDKSKVIEWIVGTIRSYVDNLPLPQDENHSFVVERRIVRKKSEIQENVCTEYAEEGRVSTKEDSSRPRDEEAGYEENSTSNEERILAVIERIVSFLRRLVDETVEKNRADRDGTFNGIKDHLLSLLIYLMGKPFCYLSNNRLNDQPNDMINLCLEMKPDLLSLLSVVKSRSKKKHKNDNSFADSPSSRVVLYESKENIPDLALSNFFYRVVSTPCLFERLPQVYHPLFVLENCLFSIDRFLVCQELTLRLKGLDFMENVIRKVNTESITPEMLEVNIFIDILNTVCNIMIFSDEETLRRKSMQIFQDYLRLFDLSAKYPVVCHLLATVKHSGLLGFVASFVKDVIIENLNKHPGNPVFLNKNLERLMKMICVLQNGSNTDLVEISDEVVSSLNLLRFLLIRDNDNKTGIWNIIDFLSGTYLTDLRKGILLCKMHWSAKLNDLKEMKNNKENDVDTKVDLFVGGKKLPPVSVSVKIDLCFKAINGLDVMESILARVNECVDSNNPLKT